MTKLDTSIELTNAAILSLRDEAGRAGDLAFASGLLRLSDGGWTAEFDGEETDIYKNHHWATTGQGTGCQGADAPLDEWVFETIETALDMMAEAAFYAAE